MVLSVVQRIDALQPYALLLNERFLLEDLIDLKETDPDMDVKPAPCPLQTAQRTLPCDLPLLWYCCY